MLIINELPPPVIPRFFTTALFYLTIGVKRGYSGGSFEEIVFQKMVAEKTRVFERLAESIKPGSINCSRSCFSNSLQPKQPA